MSIPDWDLKKIRHDIYMAIMLGLLAWCAREMTYTKVILAESALRIEQCMQKGVEQSKMLAQHEGRIHTLEIDVNTLKVHTQVP